MTITRKSLAETIEEYDAQIEDLNDGKRDTFIAYRAQLAAEGKDKEAIAEEIAAFKKALRYLRAKKADPMKVEREGDLVDEILAEIDTASRRAHARVENIEEFPTGQVAARPSGNTENDHEDRQVADDSASNIFRGNYTLRNAGAEASQPGEEPGTDFVRDSDAAAPPKGTSEMSQHAPAGDATDETGIDSEMDRASAAGAIGESEASGKRPEGSPVQAEAGNVSHAEDSESLAVGESPTHNSLHALDQVPESSVTAEEATVPPVNSSSAHIREAHDVEVCGGERHDAASFAHSGDGDGLELPADLRRDRNNIAAFQRTEISHGAIT